LLDMGSLAWLAIAVVASGAAGVALGWRLRERGEEERRRAVEASAEEFVAAAGRARDRERADREGAEARLRAMRRHQKRWAETVERLEAERDEARKLAGLTPAEQQGERIDWLAEPPPIVPAQPASAKASAAAATTPAQLAEFPIAAEDAPAVSDAAAPGSPSITPLASRARRTNREPPRAVRAWAAKSAGRAARLRDSAAVAAPAAVAVPPAAPPASVALAEPTTPAPRAPALDPAVVAAVARARTTSAPPAARTAAAKPRRRRRPSAAGPARPEWLLEAPQGQKDDLTAIRGIGPGLEHRLNGLGIFHYRQLAHLTDADADWLGNQLPVRGRVRRDRWSQQARLILSRCSSQTP
jgi:predicted flap endonuclease-1-like 5' DNA nuclease